MLSVANIDGKDILDRVDLIIKVLEQSGVPPDPISALALAMAASMLGIRGGVFKNSLKKSIDQVYSFGPKELAHDEILGMVDSSIDAPPEDIARAELALINDATATLKGE